MRHHRIRIGLAAASLAAAVTLITSAGPALSQAGSDWPQYLYGPAHSSYNAAETAITTANAAALITGNVITLR